MITLNVSELHEVAVIVATAFPVLAVAYYSAARQQLDQLLTDEGPGWTVNMTIPTCNAVELGCRMEQADRRRRVVGNVLLFSPLHQESRMLRAFHCAGAGALPTSRVRPLCDFLNGLPDCLRESQRGKKPPARKPGGG